MEKHEYLEEAFPKYANMMRFALSDDGKTITFAYQDNAHGGENRIMVVDVLKLFRFIEKHSINELRDISKACGYGAVYEEAIESLAWLFMGNGAESAEEFEKQYGSKYAYRIADCFHKYRNAFIKKA